MAKLPGSKGALPTITLPTKLAGRARSVNKSSGYANGDTLRKDNQPNPNVSIQTLRFGQNAAATMRALHDVDGMVSAVVTNYLATALSGWRVTAYQSWTNEFSSDGLLAAETIISGLDTLWNYTQGYQDKQTVDQLTEMGVLEVLLTGGIAAELILDTSRIPQGIILFPYDSITWKSNGKGGRVAWQKDRQGVELELNYPTIFIAEAMRMADRNYSIPMAHSGLKQLFAYVGFIEDMQRVLRKNGQPRLTAKLDYVKVMASAPGSIAGDQAKLAAYLEDIRLSMQTLLSQLEPEDALVYYDLAEMEAIRSDGEKRDYSELLTELSGLSASALKSNPSALGLRMGGSQNVSSTEAMLSMKMAAMIQKPIETVLSRALTLAVRLYGIDAYIKFKFDDIDLRPKAELESHKAIQQNRVLELLSLGRITDDEAQTMLGLGSLPKGAKPLSGTEFYGSKAPDTTPVAASNALNQSIAPDTPKAAGGKDNKQRP
jgi:hypothetical protein